MEKFRKQEIYFLPKKCGPTGKLIYRKSIMPNIFKYNTFTNKIQQMIIFLHYTFFSPLRPFHHYYFNLSFIILQLLLSVPFHDFIFKLVQIPYQLSSLTMNIPIKIIRQKENPKPYCVGMNYVLGKTNVLSPNI